MVIANIFNFNKFLIIKIKMNSLRELEKLIYIESGVIPLKRETSKDFFKKHKNRYLLDIIFNYLTFEDKVRLRFLNRLVFSVVALNKQLINFKQLKEDFIEYLLDKPTFESCIMDFHRMPIKNHKNLLINEFYSTWAISRFLEKESTIKISLFHNKLKGQSRQLLFSTLRKINKPLELQLNDIQLNPEKMGLLFNNLRGKDVELLNIGKNTNIDDVLVETVSEVLSTFKNLKHINLDCCIPNDNVLNKISTSFKNLFKLEHIELSENRITKAGLDAFLNNISKLPKLKHLYLNDDNINAEGANLLGLYLGSWMSSSLATLSLNDNPIGHIGVGYIAQGLRKNKSLVYLSLSNNRATKEGFEALVHAIEGNKSLKTVKYTYNEVTYKLVHRLNEEILLDTNIEVVELFCRSLKGLPMKHFKTHKILL
jgi:Ran GTPase-activating protein (RanGAP) involved in mRNA processing and transport